jgi:hypothetical protein
VTGALTAAVRVCEHVPPCPPATAVDHDAARLIAAHPEQGWNLLCNGVIVFDDGGELLPDCSAVDARRGPALHIADGQRHHVG